MKITLMKNQILASLRLSAFCGMFFAFPFFCAAQEAPSRQEICPQNDCRKASTVELRTKEGKKFIKSFEFAPPILQDGLITVLAGETVFIEAARLGEQLGDLHVVPKNLHPEKTIVLKLEQMENRVAMMFTLFNPFPALLKFEIGIQTLDRQAPIKVKSCPVPAGKEGYEGWEEPVFQVFLRNGRFLPKDTREVEGCS